MKYRTNFFVLSSLTLLTATMFSSKLLASDTPNPNEVYVKRLTLSGSGCAASTVNSHMSSDAKAFTLLFDDFIAEVGPNVPQGKQRSKCRVIIDLQFPQGWSYTLFKADYRGFADLDSGVTATQTSKYYFQSSANNYQSFQSVFEGSYYDDYLLTDQIPMNEVVWSPCGKTKFLNIETELAIDNEKNRNNGGMITLDSMDGSFYHKYGIRWLRCY